MTNFLSVFSMYCTVWCKMYYCTRKNYIKKLCKICCKIQLNLLVVQLMVIHENILSLSQEHVLCLHSFKYSSNNIDKKKYNCDKKCKLGACRVQQVQAGSSLLCFKRIVHTCGFRSSFFENRLYAELSNTMLYLSFYL